LKKLFDGSSEFRPFVKVFRNRVVTKATPFLPGIEVELDILWCRHSEQGLDQAEKSRHWYRVN
jgi:hypothetical protein